MKAYKFIFTLLALSVLGACKKTEVIAPKVSIPTASKIEIGTGNNKRGLIGRDLHLDGHFNANGKIKDVSIKIIQKKGEKYSKVWKFEKTWTEYEGAKNAEVHKHITIPNDAPTGKYDFFFIVTDQKGQNLEIKQDISLFDPLTMPIDPKIATDILFRNDSNIYSKFAWWKDVIFKKGDKLTALAIIENIKGDGVLYSVLINQKLNYFPETPDNLDLSKVTILSKIEHKGLPENSKITTKKNRNNLSASEDLIIGKDKLLEPGKYNWAILYKNSTYDMSVYKNIEIIIK